jgi:DHA3 family macrolide efflux protein-like MFS transporter
MNRVALARFISRSGGEAAFFVGIWGKASYEFNATPSELALVMAALGIASLVGSIWSGLLVDRLGPRRVLILGELAFIPAVLALVLARNITEFAFLVFFSGLLTTPVYTAVASMAPFLTNDPNQLAAINSRIETGTWAAFVIGPAMGALLVRLVSLDSIFVLDAVTSLIGVAVVYPIRLRTPEGPSVREPFLAEVVAGIRYVAARPALRFFVLATSSVWLAFGAFSALEPLFYREVLRVGPEAMGWVNSIFGLGLVAGTFLVPRLRSAWRRSTALAALVALNGAAGLLYVATDHLPVVAAGGVIWGLIIGIFAVVSRTLIQTATPDHLMGRVQATAQMSADVVRLLPLLVIPALAVRWGVQEVLIGNVLTLAGVGIVLYPMSRRFAAGDLRASHNYL